MSDECIPQNIGSCGKIIMENNIVRKIMHKRHNGRSAESQYNIQRMCNSIMTRLGLKNVYIPNVYTFDNNSYTMDLINCENEIISQSPSFIDEIAKWKRECINIGIEPIDYELYLQPDGRIALVDFDKFKTNLSHKNTMRVR